MAKRYDAAIKHLVEAHPADWLAFASLPAATELKVIDADVSTIGPAADKVIHVLAPEPYVAHFEFQSSADSQLNSRMLLYNVLLRWRHKLPVRSVVVLLRPQADGSGSSGAFSEVAAPDSRLEFRYRVIRLWQQPVANVLAGGLGVLPLAPITDAPEESLSQVIETMKARFEAEAPRTELTDAWAATYILLGLRYSSQVGQSLLKGVRQMKESTTYQSIIEEGEAKGLAKGRVEEARAIVSRLGSRRFGPPSKTARETIESIQDLGHLEMIVERIVDASGWDDLLKS